MDDILQKILDYSFTVEFNANDCFHWACSDRSEISSEDLKDLLPQIEKYGFYAIIAYEALNRGYDPDPEVQSTPEEFYAAKKEIEEAVGIEKFLNLYEKIKIRKEEVDLFGEEISYESVKIRTKPYGLIACVAYVSSGLKVIDDNRYKARASLIKLKSGIE